MATHWDPDPDTIAIPVTIKKDGRLVGLMAKNAAGPNAYPTIEKIAKGTPVFDSPDIQLGDKIKYINGILVRGKTKDFVHQTVRSVATGGAITFGIIKGFKEKGFRMTGDKGLRVNSVRRENPLMAFNLAHPDENSIAEDEEGQGKDAPTDEERARAKFGDEEDDMPDTGGFQAKASVYGGFDSAPALTDEERARARFGDEEDDMPDTGGFQAKQSVYGGFAIAAPTSEGNVAGDDIDEDDEEFGFNFETLEIESEDPWS